MQSPKHAQTTRGLLFHGVLNGALGSNVRTVAVIVADKIGMDKVGPWFLSVIITQGSDEETTGAARTYLGKHHARVIKDQNIAVTGREKQTIQ